MTNVAKPSEGGGIDESPPPAIEPSRSFDKAKEKVPAAAASKRPTKKKPKDKPKRFVCVRAVRQRERTPSAAMIFTRTRLS